MTESHERAVARSLSFTQWEFLSEHFDGQRLITGRKTIWNDDRTRQSLVARGLIRIHPPSNITTRPTHTILTDKGHDVMCAALGLMADLLDAHNRANPMETFAYGKIVAPARDPFDGGRALREQD